MEEYYGSLKISDVVATMRVEKHGAIIGITPGFDNIWDDDHPGPIWITREMLTELMAMAQPEAAGKILAACKGGHGYVDGPLHA
jgi:hypothetical protein